MLIMSKIWYLRDKIVPTVKSNRLDKNNILICLPVGIRSTFTPWCSLMCVNRQSEAVSVSSSMTWNANALCLYVSSDRCTK